MYGFNQHAAENCIIMPYFTRERLSKNREDVAKFKSKNEIFGVESWPQICLQDGKSLC
jgi:hypothetical protein